MCSVIQVPGLVWIHNHHNYISGIGISSMKQLTNNIHGPTMSNSIYNRYRKLRVKTALQIDIFGLGPTEIVVIIAAGALLYPMNNNKKKSKSERNSFIPEESWEVERNERITSMRVNAEKMRTKRALERINEAILNDDEYVLDMMAQYEDMKEDVSI